MLDDYMRMLRDAGAGENAKYGKTDTEHLMTAKNEQLVKFCQAMLMTMYNDERILSEAKNLLELRAIMMQVCQKPPVIVLDEFP